MLVATSGALLLLDESLHAAAASTIAHASIARTERRNSTLAVPRPMVIPSRSFQNSLAARQRQRLRPRCSRVSALRSASCVPMSVIQESLCVVGGVRAERDGFLVLTTHHARSCDAGTIAPPSSPVPCPPRETQISRAA